MPFVFVDHTASWLFLYITTLRSLWTSKRVAEESIVCDAQATERSFFRKTRFPSDWKCREYMSGETVSVFHNFFPLQYTTKFPSFWSVKQYFPLEDFKDFPFNNINWPPLYLTHLSLQQCAIQCFEEQNWKKKLAAYIYTIIQTKFAKSRMPDNC